MYPKITLLILTIAASGCSPLRSTQTERHEALAISHTTLMELFRQEFERQIGTLRQTVVEFYPPPVRQIRATSSFPILPIRSAPFFRRRRFRRSIPLVSQSSALSTPRRRCSMTNRRRRTASPIAGSIRPPATIPRSSRKKNPRPALHGCGGRRRWPHLCC